MGILFAGLVSAETQKFELDLEESYLKWEGTRVGGGHDGRVFLKSGEMEIRGNDLVGGSFVIDMSSIKVDDIEDESRNARLRNHLLNEDFFSVDKYETSTLVITDSQLGKGGVYNVVADLTIMDSTNPVMFDSVVNVDEEKVTAKSEFSIDRTKWGIRYRSGRFFEGLGDRLIHDDIKFEVNLVAKKK